MITFNKYLQTIMMQQAFHLQLLEVTDHVKAGDIHLGYRRLLDSAIETQDMDIFKKALEFSEWFELHEKSASGEEMLSKVKDLCEQMGKVNITVKTDREKPVLELQNVSKKYAKGQFRLSDINICLHKGQILGLVGENGNGKTTLLRLMAQELKSDTGELIYYLDGNTKDLYLLRSQLIYIEQRIPKWYGSLMDNLQFTLASHGVKGEANRLWAEIMVARFGLRSFKDMSWKSISSGYKTRFEIAKTLLRKPKILLLDEPLANLDILSQQIILQDLKYMANSLTAPFGIVLSSQHIYEVEKVSDTVIFLKNGAPEYQTNTESEEKSDTLVLEIEAKNATRETFSQALQHLSLQNIQFNGGVFIIKLSSETTVNEVLQSLMENQIELTYFRDITSSSRRFFTN